ncbi:MAG: single-stranded DNA-binding protein [Lachnospiraceae bacterium]|nr:single-stranded DNA-binding protein [Lachnospiraceae bacterium]
MNKVILMGRLTRDPEIRYTQAETPVAIARFTLAVDRRNRNANNGEANADFINCVAYGSVATFIEKYAFKATKLIIEGRIQTGSYTNKDNQKVYTTDVIIENCEFAESKSTQTVPASQQAMPQQTAPQQAMPQQTAPQQAAPQQTAFQQVMPQQTVPQQATFQQVAYPPQNDGFMNIPNLGDDEVPFI